MNNDLDKRFKRMIYGTRKSILHMPGDIVTLKQNIPNKPAMIVVKENTNY